MSVFDDLNFEVNLGLEGRNNGIPMGFNRLNHYIGIRKGMYYLIGGYTGSGKCLAKSTLVLMYDGTYKKVEDIQIDDLLMSLNGESTKVISTCQGTEEMFQISQRRGEPYIVNKSHVLSLKPSGKQLMKIHGETLNISVASFLRLPQWQQDRIYGYKTSVEFNETSLSLDPYILGVWLGDGTTSQPSICTPDIEIVAAINQFAESINNYVSVKDIHRCPIYTITNGNNKKVVKLNENLEEIDIYNSLTEAVLSINRAVTNIYEAIKKNIHCTGYFWKKSKNNSISFYDILKSLNLLDNKHIPFCFSRNSRENRLQLLAGLLDTDGYFSNGKSYEIIQKSEQLANDIMWLSQSLGFYTSIHSKIATMKRADDSVYSCKVFRIQINGDICQIPCRVKRKKAKVNTPNKDNLRSHIEIKSIGKGEYYGFELGGSRLFFLKDFTVTHNTSFLDDCFVLNPYDWYISGLNKTDLKLRIVYRSMERGRVYKMAKWVARKIFLDYGIIISISKLLGWTERMSSDEHDLFLAHKDYIEEMKEVITIIDGPENPIGIANDLKAFALKHGRIEDTGEFTKVYIPNEPNTITIVVLDTMNLLKLTKTLTTKKAAIDKMSDELRYARDFYGFSPVAVSQFNRDISNPVRLKNGDVEPRLEDFKESGQTQDDADVVLALFDPIRYKVLDFSGYDLEKLTDLNGGKYYRSLKLIKNSYGEDDIRIGLGFLGQVGMFRELPRKSDITNDDYDAIINKSYFLAR